MRMRIRVLESLLSSDGVKGVEKATYRRPRNLESADLGEVRSAYGGLVSVMEQLPEQPLEEIRGAVEYLLDAVIRAERATPRLQMSDRPKSE
jgi:hypothetical protein